MTTLASQQRGLLALLKHRAFEVAQDQWLNSIARSPELMMMQEIAVWWRCYQISAQCRFTSRLLKQRNMFEQTVTEFFDAQSTPPFIEQLGLAFLHSVSAGEDPLLRAVALTELHLLSRDSVEIEWDRKPDAVFAALDRFETVPSSDPEYSYTLKLADPLRCVRAARTGVTFSSSD